MSKDACFVLQQPCDLTMLGHIQMEESFPGEGGEIEIPNLYAIDLHGELF